MSKLCYSITFTSTEIYGGGTDVKKKIQNKQMPEAEK